MKHLKLSIFILFLALLSQTGLGQMTLSFTINDVNCNGGSDGSITVHLDGGTPPYTYTWSTLDVFTTSDTFSIISGLPAKNTYWVIVEDSSVPTPDDEYSGFLVVAEPPVLNIDSENKTDITCNGADDGTISITASGGNPPYEYSIDGGSSFFSNGGNFSGLAGGIYPVIVRDSKNCSTIGSSLTIVDPPGITITSQIPADITCNGFTDGTITIAASGGTPPYQYSIDGGANFLANGGIFTGLSAGNYDVVVRDVNLCTKDGATLTIVEPPLLVIDSQTKTDVSCNGGNDGTITITASGGVPAYNYSIDGGANFLANGGVFIGLIAGNYPVAIRDINGCITSGLNLIITEPAALVINSETNTNVSCNGGNDGTITITVSGGIAPYEYSINGGATFFANGGNFAGLFAGNYDIAVRDVNTCITSGATLNITEPPVLLIDSQLKTDITCNSLTDGTITITASGGTPPYRYSIDGGANYLANGGVFTGLSAGNYNVAVQDANSCITSGAILIIVEPSPLVIDSQTKTDVSCSGGNDGTISISCSGGVPSYEYSIDAGVNFVANGGSFTGLIAGIYDVAVRDANGCITNGLTLNVNEPTPLVIDSEINTNISCNGGNDGTITITVSGGIAPYEYSINGGTTFLANGGIFIGLLAGNYDIDVRDANSCITSGATLNLTEPTVLLIDSQQKADITCNNLTDGTITITASGGTPLYRYSIDGGANYLANGGVFTGLSAGNYDVAVQDANGCITFGATLNIADPTALLIDSGVKTDITCNGLTDGTITISASGGIAPYEYSIDGGVNFVTNGGSFTGLPANNYDIAVRDANGCVTLGATLNVSEPSALVIDSETNTNVSCNGGTDGTITITASGGTPAYNYSIDGGITFFNNTGNFTGLSAGNYDVAIRDANGCITNGATLNITEPPALIIDSETSTNILCNGDTDVTITITASGGIPPYQYSIDGGNNFLANGGSFTGLAAGNYDIAIRDNNLCITNGSTLNISEPDALVIDSESKTDISCNGLNDGTITIVVSGGIAVYEYSIDGGATFSSNEGSFTGLIAGIYDIAVRDLNLCITLGSSVTLIEPAPLNIDSENTANVLCFGGNDGQISIAASGGTSPYSFSVDGGITYFLNGGIFDTLSAGNYNLRIRDTNGCELAGGAHTLTEPPVLTMIVDTTKATCNSFTNDGAIVITAGGGTPGYNYSIDGGINWQANPDFNNLLTGTYDVVIRDINSCTLSLVTDLESKYIVNANAGPSEGTCPGEGIMLQGSGGTGYQWVPGSGLSDPLIANPIATPSETTTYYLTVSQGVCNDLDSVLISVFTVPQISAGRDTTIFKGTTFTLQATPGFDTYLWSPLNGLISSPTEASVVTMPENSIIYKIVGTTLDGCESSDSIFISVIENFVIPSGFTPNGDAYNNTWVIDNAWLFPDIEVKVVNRWGQTVFYSRGYGNGIEWDGTNKGKELPIGTYYYVIILNDGGNTPPMTGPITIIR